MVQYGQETSLSSAEQVRAYTYSRTTSVVSHSGAKMGKHIDGLHHRPTQGSGKDCIYVVVDRLTKFAHFYTIPKDSSAVQVVKLFFMEVFRLHGFPRNIVSDRDSRFIGRFWRELFRLVGTELTTNTNYTLRKWADRDSQQVG
jgi:hypothetical protein